MRRFYTVRQLHEMGFSDAAIRWAEERRRLRLIERGVYGDGPEDPAPLDRALAPVVATGGVASGRVAGVLLGFDGVGLAGPDFTVPAGASGRRPGARRRRLAPERIVCIEGVPCVDALQALVDIASEVDDRVWEQALESALRTRLTTIDAVEQAARSRVRGVVRMRRVLALRPVGAPPTESLLETLMVQLARTVPGLPDPVRQLVVRDADGRFVARVDLAWPELGLFVELDGQHHTGQPVYDARRETAVVAATGWLCGRFLGTRSYACQRPPHVASQPLSSRPAGVLCCRDQLGGYTCMATHCSSPGRGWAPRRIVPRYPAACCALGACSHVLRERLRALRRGPACSTRLISPLGSSRAGRVPDGAAPPGHLRRTGGEAGRSDGARSRPGLGLRTGGRGEWGGRRSVRP